MPYLPLATLSHDVASLFVAQLGRAPEFAALNAYLEHYLDLRSAQPDSTAGRATAFQQLAEQIHRDGIAHGEIPHGLTVSHTTYLQHIYQHIFGRNPDPAGAAYWQNALTTGELSRAEVVAILIEAALSEHPQDAAALEHRVQVAVAFAQWENSNPQLLPTLQFDAATVLLGVDANAASLAPALQRLHNHLAEQGERWLLTQGVDQIQGTYGNDRFEAFPIDPMTGQPATTLGPWDTINGNHGHNVLNVYIGHGQNTVLQGNLQHLHTIHAIALDGQPLASVDLSQFGEVREFWQSHAATHVSGIGATHIGLRHITLQPPGSDTPLQLHTTASGLQLRLDQVTVTNPDPRLPVLQVYGDQLAALTIVAEPGQEGTLPLAIRAGEGVESFEIHGNAALWLTSLHSTWHQPGGVHTVDASASTGELFYLVDIGVQTLLGGQGDTTWIWQTPGQFDLWTTVHGGGGGINTIVVANRQFHTQDYDALNQTEQIQQLGLTAGQLVLDASAVPGFSGLILTGLGLAHQAVATVHHLGAHQTLTVAAQVDALVTLQHASADTHVVVEQNAALDLYHGLASTDSSERGTLTISGAGRVDYDNQIGRYQTLDFSQLQGDEAALGLWGMAAELSETLHLAEGLNALLYLDLKANAASSSSIEQLDTIVGFDAEHTTLLGLGHTIQTLTWQTPPMHLQDAFALAANAYAASGATVLCFVFAGDTYLYADTIAPQLGQADPQDFALRLSGEQAWELWHAG